MKKVYVLGVLLFLFNQTFSQKYQYNVDIDNFVDGKVKVELICPEIKGDEIVFSFPKCIPGWYFPMNYGNLIKNLSAYDGNGSLLMVKKVNQNSFRISGAKKLSKITYKVEASFSSKKGRKIFRAAGTSFEKDKNFLLNNGAIFGYFEGVEDLPLEIAFIKPKNLDGYSGLRIVSKTLGSQIFEAGNYSELIDCPIMFTLPDTCYFRVGNCKFKIVVYAGTGSKYSLLFSEKLKPKMVAVEKFLGKLPVDTYTFLFYLNNVVELKKLYDAGKVSKLEILRLIRSGFDNEGALEHRNSSTYYYQDKGDSSFYKYPDLIDGAVHEFLHTTTPKSLHSNLIGSFDFSNPKMSKHLWLYEGVDEYFTHLALLQGNAISAKDFFTTMKDKITRGEQFPVSNMSFTEMSQKVLQKKYSKQYKQVYRRGAVLAFLLDAEIIRLTNGSKNLRDVILKLCTEYGLNKSFDEDTFIDKFVGEVRPDLKIFFDRYISGRENWSLADGFKTIGIEYYTDKIISRPRHPQYSNDVKVKFIGKGRFEVTKTGNKEWAGLLKGDTYDYNVYPTTFNVDDCYVPEGSTVNMPILRNGKAMILPIKVVYLEQKTSSFKELENKTDEQKRFFNKWIGK